MLCLANKKIKKNKKRKRNHQFTGSGGGVSGQPQQPQLLEDEGDADEEAGEDGQEEADVEVLHLLGRGLAG